jgi:hypothetical protein
MTSTFRILSADPGTTAGCDGESPSGSRYRHTHFTTIGRIVRRAV